MTEDLENSKPNSRNPPRSMTFNQKLSNGIAIVVVSIWALSMVVDMIPQANYDPPVAIYPALMLVLGAMFGLRIVRGGGE